jgi:hypothetical protein
MTVTNQNWIEEEIKTRFSATIHPEFFIFLPAAEKHNN